MTGDSEREIEREKKEDDSLLLFCSSKTSALGYI